MEQFIGLDVSLKDTDHLVRGRPAIWRGQMPVRPQADSRCRPQRAPHAKRVVFETGPPVGLVHHALTLEGCRRSASMPARQGCAGYGTEQDRRE